MFDRGSRMVFVEISKNSTGKVHTILSKAKGSVSFVSPVKDPSTGSISISFLCDSRDLEEILFAIERIPGAAVAECF